MFADGNTMKKRISEGGIAPGTKWEDVPEDFECPLCFVGKINFQKNNFIDIL